MDFILLLVIFYFCSFLGILVHEMGHVLMYILFYRENNWNVELGRKSLILAKFRKFTIYANMTMGYTRVKYKKYSKYKSTMFFLGGPLASSILVLLLLPYISQFVGISFLENSNFAKSLIYFFYLNLFILIVSVIPIKIGNYTSDGMNLLYIFKNKYNDN